MMNFKGRDRKRVRQSYRGYPKQNKKTTPEVEQTKVEPTKAVPATTTPKFAPVSDEVTVYGAKKYRTPIRKDEFTGTQGSPILAGVLDIDGTLSGYGQGSDSKVLKWVKEVYETKGNEDMVWLVITARDHGTFGYETSFNWLMRHFPYPFIGPFARAKDDPRYASEFKRELAQGFEDMGLYQIIAAADDNEFVIDMWKQWAKDHFEDPEDFKIMEAGYGSYAGWRSDLESKYTPSKGYSSYGTGYYDQHKDEVWISQWTDTGGVVHKGHYAKRDGVEHQLQKARDAAKRTKYASPTGAVTSAKHRPAGTATQSAWGSDPADGKWKARKDFIKPEGEDDEAQVEVLETANYTLSRHEVEAWVAHDYPTKTPEEISAMSNSELWEAVELDYREDVEQAIETKWPGVFDHRDAIEWLELSELEELLEIDEVEEAVEYVATILSYVDGPGSRDDLEAEVYANTQLTLNTIRGATTEQLKLWLDSAGTSGDEMPETGPLDIAEILSEMGETAYTPPEGVEEVVEAIIAEHDRKAVVDAVVTEVLKADEQEKGVA